MYHSGGKKKLGSKNSRLFAVIKFGTSTIESLGSVIRKSHCASVCWFILKYMNYINKGISFYVINIVFDFLSVSLSRNKAQSEATHKRFGTAKKGHRNQ
jgi:ABC-type thiamin/hydroxymethylpyrimidine transport system permease subunit